MQVLVLQQVAGLLPSEDVVRWHAPRRASIGSLAHQKFEEQLRLVEVPTRFAIRQNGPEQAPRASPPKEMLLVGRFIVRIAGRKHHAFDAQLHHFVKKRAYTLRIVAVEQRCLRGYAEALLLRFPDPFDSQIV